MIHAAIMTKRILIIDDNAMIRRLLRTALESEERAWTVCGEACDGREGVQMVQDMHPDVALLDLAMPVMNGLEAARVLRETMPEVPLIMCSLHVEPSASGGEEGGNPRDRLQGGKYTSPDRGGGEPARAELTFRRATSQGISGPSSAG